MNTKEKLLSMRKNRVALDIRQRTNMDATEYQCGATRFGGSPDLPRDFVWPTFDDGEALRPLAFLAQFNCTELIEFDIEKRLPDHGLLSFFYELDTQRWGYDPNDRGCARVYWFEDLSQLSAAEFPDELDVEYRLPILNIRLSAETSLPSLEDFLTAFPQETDDSYIAAYNELTAASDTYSQLLGWPDVLQNNMYTECDLVSKGYYLGNGWIGIDKEDRRLANESAYQRWQLLFQLDTIECDDFELMFGDCGHIYFYIPTEDLMARRFDRIWLILQCG